MISMESWLEQRYSFEQEIEKLEEELKEEHHQRWEQEDRADLLAWFIKKFIEEGNKKDQTLEEAYARMFEIYKEENIEEYL